MQQGDDSPLQSSRLTLEEIGGVLGIQFGIHGWHVEKPKEGWSEKSFIATCDDQRVFVKFDISVPVLERLALLGVAPEVLARGEYRGHPFIVQKFIRGSYPTRQWFSENLAFTAELIQRYHQDEYLATLMKERPPTYHQHILARLTELDRRIQAATSPRLHSRGTEQSLDAFRAQADRLPAETLVPTHGDPSYKNFLVSSQRVYLVDWDDLALSDPIRDIGPLLWWYVPSERWREFFAAYGVSPDQALLDRLFWWVAEESLDIALALDERGYHEDTDEFFVDFAAAIRQEENPHRKPS